MNELVKQVTPLTRGIIWLPKDELTAGNPHYTEIDYLLDGLLTANLRFTGETTSQVVIGQNFNQPLYVMIIKEIKASEIESYLSLVKPSLGPENDIIVIDEAERLPELKSHFKSIGPHLRTV